MMDDHTPWDKSQYIPWCSHGISMKSHDEVGEKSLFWVTYVPAYATGPKKGLSRMRWIRTSRGWIYSFKDDHFEGWFSHLNSDTDFDVGKKRMVSFSRPLEKSHWYRGHLRILGSNLSLSQDLFCSTFCKGKIQNNNPELPRIPPIFQVSALQELPGRHKQLQKPLEAASAQQLQLDSSSDGVQSYRKNGGVSSE